MYYLGFYEIQTVDIKYTTSIEKTVNQNDVIKIKFIITQPLQYTRSDRDISFGFYDIEDISKMTEITSSKRDCRERIYFYNRLSLSSIDQYPQRSTYI